MDPLWIERPGLYPAAAYGADAAPTLDSRSQVSAHDVAQAIAFRRAGEDTESWLEVQRAPAKPNLFTP